MNARQKRSIYAALALIGIATAAVLVIQAMQSNMAYFFSPSQVMNGEIQPGTTFRLGGMVVDDSLNKSADSLKTEFTVTDSAEDVRVSYTGILPDLFKEGQGTVAKGKLGEDGKFYAEEVLAKHDEAYMPPEVAEAMKTGAANQGKTNGDPGYSSQVEPTI
jgi:cytochrome c-type biogenesis protein CcmE